MLSPLISKKLPSSARVVWFEPSNQWVYLEEPAWYVLRGLNNKTKKEWLAQKFSKRYMASMDEGMRFIEEMAANIADWEKPGSKPAEEEMEYSAVNYLRFSPFITHHYRMKRMRVSISYGSQTAEYYIHPPLAHLVEKEAVKEEVAMKVEDELKGETRFEIFEHEGKPVIRKKGDPGFTTSAPDFTRLKIKLFIELSDIMHHKTDDDWMAFLHASGVEAGGKAILFSSASGSGKSTLVAVLQANGLRFFSDDFVPIDARNKRAWPFPAAISVKEGAFDLLSGYYGNLRDKSYNLYPYTHPSVRFLHPPDASDESLVSRHVKALIFVNYKPGAKFRLQRLSISEALQLFHQQARVSSKPQHAGAFINWFLKLECYTMEYSDSREALKVVRKLFVLP